MIYEVEIAEQAESDLREIIHEINHINSSLFWCEI